MPTALFACGTYSHPDFEAKITILIYPTFLVNPLMPAKARPQPPHKKAHHCSLRSLRNGSTNSHFTSSINPYMSMPTRYSNKHPSTITPIQPMIDIANLDKWKLSDFSSRTNHMKAVAITIIPTALPTIMRRSRNKRLTPLPLPATHAALWIQWIRVSQPLYRITNRYILDLCHALDTTPQPPPEVRRIIYWTSTP